MFQNHQDNHSFDDIRAPSLWLLLLETRIVPEMGAYYLWKKALETFAPHGSHPVVVLPGFGTTDASTLPLRRLLIRLGYEVYGWDQGRNLGMRPPLRKRLLKRIENLSTVYGKKVSLVGHSLGGIFARELAKDAPEFVRQVITMGSPMSGPPQANNIETIFHLFNPHNKATVNLETLKKRRIPPPVPSTSIFTRTDGIVAWQGACEMLTPLTENIEVIGSHSGLCFNPMALYVVAERLAQPEGEWRPFERTLLKKIIFPNPHR
ncbi:MAG: alpha/beta hydrolase [SAR324 cluster bacterium]|nr:alpha/beta hydrolase [SAR324 cluster bacterium]